VPPRATGKIGVDESRFIFHFILSNVFQK
jgi:hypothetical protein